MALETERKYLDVNFEELRERLGQAGACYMGSRFESNILYDNEAGFCEKGNRLIRLRIIESPDKIYNVFTVKWPVSTAIDKDARFKIREELETEIPDAQIFNEMLLQMGFKAVLTYEKVRESWKLDYRNDERVSIDLDTLAFCKAVEIEASCDAINHVSAQLDLDKYKISTTSYTKLYQEWLKGGDGNKISDLLFKAPEREALRKSLGLLE